MPQTSKNILDIGLFTGISQLENFSNFKNLIPVREISASPAPLAWDEGSPIALPKTYVSAGIEKPVDALLDRLSTSALLVIRDGKIRYENYWHTGGRDVQWISFSVAKSFVSAIIGTLVDDGTIASIEDPISDYIAVNPGSAYDGVSIRDVLTMSSGARWNEDYSDPNSDALELTLSMAGIVGTLEQFVARRTRELSPGTLCRYNSGDTQALGHLIQAATGKTVAEVTAERLLHPLGTEANGYWWIDASGNEAVFAGLNLTARDFARLGELYRRGGDWHGTQIISREWVEKSTTATARHLEAGQVDGSLGVDPMGYGYQWWLPTFQKDSFAAAGVYNQFIYVEPSTNTTIVMLSANQSFGQSQSENDNLGDESLRFLASLAAGDF